MTPAEADRFIVQARRVLRGWRAELAEHIDDYSEDGGDSRGGARQVIRQLREIAAEHPGKAAKIEALIRPIEGLMIEPCASNASFNRRDGNGI